MSAFDQRIAVRALAAAAISLRALQKLGLPEGIASEIADSAYAEVRDALVTAATGTNAAIRDVLAERARQVEAEGWTPAHDDEHDAGDLAAAGSCYALSAAVILNPYTQGDGVEESTPPHAWPWESAWWKIDREDPRRALVKAAALLIAEIERIDRKEARS